MKSRLIALFALGIAAVSAQAEVSTMRREALPSFTVSGPVTHDNLSVFLLHGKNMFATERKVLTTQEALEQKKLIIHETSNVNELSLENVSDDVDIFIQSCEIFKGGKQDRITAMDTLLSPRSGKTPIPSFCCEQGRWQQRGRENAARFESSPSVAANGSLKAAVNSQASQQMVWAEVSKAQKQLSENLGGKVTQNVSPTSYQLAIESKAVKEKVDCYVKALAGALKDKNDVIGVAMAVNGQIRSVDLYGSNTLLLKLWDKLLQGAAIDALSELDNQKKFSQAETKDVEKFLARAELGKWSELKPASANVAPNADPATAAPTAPAEDGKKEGRARVQICDSEKIILVETKDTQSRNQVVHRSYVAK